MHAKFKGLTWLVAGVLAAAIAAGALPAMARHIPWSWEAWLARGLGNPLTIYGECKPSDPQAEAAWRKLQARLFPHYPDDAGIPLSLHLVHSSQVNAFAFLNGEIVVFSELLARAQTPEELAGVLAHEMEHVKRRHLMQHLSTQVLVQILWAAVSGDLAGAGVLQRLLDTRFTRTQEAEADEGAFQRLHDTSTDVGGIQTFFKRLSEDSSSHLASLLSDHPSDDSRSQRATQFAVAHPKPILDADEWSALKHYCSAP